MLKLLESILRIIGYLSVIFVIGEQVFQTPYNVYILYMSSFFLFVCLIRSFPVSNFHDILWFPRVRPFGNISSTVNWRYLFVSKQMEDTTFKFTCLDHSCTKNSWDPRRHLEDCIRGLTFYTTLPRLTSIMCYSIESRDPIPFHRRE